MRPPIWYRRCPIGSPIRPPIWYRRCPIWYQSPYLYIRPLIGVPFQIEVLFIIIIGPLIWYGMCPIWDWSSHLYIRYDKTSCSNDNGNLTHLAGQMSQNATGAPIYIHIHQTSNMIWEASVLFHIGAPTYISDLQQGRRGRINASHGVLPTPC